MADLNKSWARCLGVSEPWARLHAQVLPNSCPSNLAQVILHQILTSLGQDAMGYLGPWVRLIAQVIPNSCPSNIAQDILHQI